MKTPVCTIKKLIAPGLASLFLVACSATPLKPEGADNLRSRLTQLQADPQLASRAPVAIKEAAAAVSAAETPQSDVELGKHLVLIADRKVEIARSRAQARLLEDQRETLGEQREAALLEARTREADRARRDARVAQSDAKIARNEAELAKAEADRARSAAEVAKAEAESARSDTEAARLAAAAAKQKADDLQKQLTLLNAKQTDRGLVVTLGDILFDSGQSGIKRGATSNLSRLAAFLNKYPERSAVIEGHTDALGSDDSNQALSQRRADAVKSYLVGQGIANGRLTASGKGEALPVASNDSPSGRQQNRRVEVIITNQ